jgi:hypothetical protein
MKHVQANCSMEAMVPCTSSFVPQPPYCLSHVPKFNCFVNHFCADDDMKEAWSEKLKAKMRELQKKPLRELAQEVAAIATVKI